MTPRHKPPFQFGLRSLLAITAIAGLALAFWRIGQTEFVVATALAVGFLLLAPLTMDHRFGRVEIAILVIAFVVLALWIVGLIARNLLPSV